jgi:hypothetical protein
MSTDFWTRSSRYGLVHKAAAPLPTRRHSWCSSMGPSGTVAGLGAVCPSGFLEAADLDLDAVSFPTRPGSGSGPRSHRRPMTGRPGSTPSFGATATVFVTHSSGGLVVNYHNQGTGNYEKWGPLIHPIVRVDP